MEIVSVITTSTLVFATLVAKALTKIMLMLFGVIIAFLAIPQSRAAAMLGIAIVSAFAGGILIEGYSVEQNWTLPVALSVAFGSGFIVYPFLTFFKKFNQLVSEDNEIVELLFKAFKSGLLRFIPKK